MLLKLSAAILVSQLCIGIAVSQELRGPQFLREARQGFVHVYNIEYDAAEQLFTALQARYPHHPGPPLYLATVTWLRELLARNELDLDRFLAPGYFAEPTDRQMPESQRLRFFQLIQESQDRCQAILQEEPNQPDALYFLGTTHGVLGSFAITVDHEMREAFGQGKKAYRYHKEIIDRDAHYYDAYMSVGLYEYIVDNLPWYIKWLAVLIGYSGSEERGFKYLQWAVDKGTFVRDDARVLQMVLLVREERYQEALASARLLHDKYPRNYLLHLNVAQILEKMNRRPQAADVYREVLQRAEARQPNYQQIPLDQFRPRIEKKLAELRGR